MDWDAIGAIGEVIGGVAVIASLIYLAIQVRVNSDQVERNTKAQVALTEFSSDERAQQKGFVYTATCLRGQPQGGYLPADEIGQLVYRGNLGQELPELDAMRYREWVRSLMGSHQTFFLAYSEGLESEAMWNYWKRTFSQLLSMPGFAAAWKELEPLSDEEFRAYITNENFR